MLLAFVVSVVIENVVPDSVNPDPAEYVVSEVATTAKVLSPRKKVVLFFVPDALSIPMSTAPEAIVEDIAALLVPLNVALPVTSPVKENVLVLASCVVVAELPVHEPEEPDVLPVTFPTRLALSVPVVIDRFPVLDPVKVPVPT